MPRPETATTLYLLGFPEVPPGLRAKHTRGSPDLIEDVRNTGAMK
jgi:hypothetical protein